MLVVTKEEFKSNNNVPGYESYSPEQIALEVINNQFSMDQLVTDMQMKLSMVNEAKNILEDVKIAVEYNKPIVTDMVNFRIKQVGTFLDVSYEDCLLSSIEPSLESILSKITSFIKKVFATIKKYLLKFIDFLKKIASAIVNLFKKKSSSGSDSEYAPEKVKQKLEDVQKKKEEYDNIIKELNDKGFSSLTEDEEKILSGIKTDIKNYERQIKNTIAEMPFIYLINQELYLDKGKFTLNSVEKLFEILGDYTVDLREVARKIPLEPVININSFINKDNRSTQSPMNVVEYLIELISILKDYAKSETKFEEFVMKQGIDSLETNKLPKILNDLVEYLKTLNISGPLVAYDGLEFNNDITIANKLNKDFLDKILKDNKINLADKGTLIAGVFDDELIILDFNKVRDRNERECSPLGVDLTNLYSNFISKIENGKYERVYDIYKDVVTIFYSAVCLASDAKIKTVKIEIPDTEMKKFLDSLEIGAGYNDFARSTILKTYTRFLAKVQNAINLNVEFVQVLEKNLNKHKTSIDSIHSEIENLLKEIDNDNIIKNINELLMITSEGVQKLNTIVITLTNQITKIVSKEVINMELKKVYKLMDLFLELIPYASVLEGEAVLIE